VFRRVLHRSIFFIEVFVTINFVVEL
jgi:hypothetical protein